MGNSSLIFKLLTGSLNWQDFCAINVASNTDWIKCPNGLYVCFSPLFWKGFPSLHDAGMCLGIAIFPGQREEQLGAWCSCRWVEITEVSCPSPIMSWIIAAGPWTQYLCQCLCSLSYCYTDNYGSYSFNETL